MMIAAGMGYPRGLLQLLLVLTFTAVGTQAKCESQEVFQMISCFTPHLGKLLPLAGAHCNKELITEDVCNVFKEVKDCAIRENVAAACLEDSNLKQLKQSGETLGCAVKDFQDKCPNVLMIKTKTATGTKAKPSEETADETKDSEETADETEDSEETATGRKAKPSKGAASTSRASLVLVLVFTIRLLLMSM